MANSPPQQSPVSHTIGGEPEFLRDVLVGLNRPRKELNCKYFYDERGSRLFDQICELEEYYLTRTEQAIMDRNVEEMAGQIGRNSLLIEFGSGSSIKTRSLLDALETPVAYVPIDISEEHLLKTAEELRRLYPDIEVLPLTADFTAGFELPRTKRVPSHAAVYFPGSTIGNFKVQEASRMLITIAEVLGPEGGLLIGIDLQKEPSIIEAAYNDSRNITAEFNLNLLHRINRELSGDFELERFSHRAAYDPEAGRVEICIVSDLDQTARIDGHEFEFRAGETILTEYSHKYTIEGFAQIAAAAQFSLHRSWTDADERFAVLHLVKERP